jgi:hypothetical protein
MLLYILGLAILALLAIVLNDPMDPEELARFYAPRKVMWDSRAIIAPPMITGPTLIKEEYVDGDMDGILPPYHIHETNGYKIIEGTPQIAVPNQKYFP